MKKLLLISALFIAACNSNGDKNKPGRASSTRPKSGSIIVADSTLIVEDQLNHQYFSVAVIATDSSVNGTYDIEAHWGYNLAINTIKMPYGGEHFKPLLRKGTEPYSFIVGFHFNDDTVFHEYYAIEAQHGQMMMKYVKAYTLQ